MNAPQDNTISRNTRLLEFSVVFLLVVITLWQIIPGINDSIRLTHETTVKHSASALRDSVRWLQLQQQINLGERSEAQKMLSQLQNNSALPDRSWCATFWPTLLGGAAPSASLSGQQVFHVQMIQDSQHNIGCRYRYTLAGNLFIDYFPKMGIVTVDDTF